MSESNSKYVKSLLSTSQNFRWNSSSKQILDVLGSKNKNLRLNSFIECCAQNKHIENQKVWDTISYFGKYIAVKSVGSSLVIVIEEDKSEYFIQTLNSEIRCVSLKYNHEKLHIFCSDIQGKIHYIQYNIIEKNIFSQFEYHTNNREIRSLEPVFLEDDCRTFSLWLISDSSVEFYVYTDLNFHPVLFYNISKFSFKFLMAENVNLMQALTIYFVNNESDSIGIAVLSTKQALLYFNKMILNELQPLQLDKIPFFHANIKCQTLVQNDKNQGFSYFFGSSNNQTQTATHEKLLYCVTDNFSVDPIIDNTFPDALTKISFSFDVYSLGDKGTINCLKYQTAQNYIINYLEENKNIINLDTLEGLKEQHFPVSSIYTSSFYQEDGTIVENTSSTSAKLPIWSIITQQKLIVPRRKEKLLDLIGQIESYSTNDFTMTTDIIFQLKCLLLEFFLAANLPDLFSFFILKRNNLEDSFEVEDVKLLYDWLLGSHPLISNIPSLNSDLINSTELFLKNHFFNDHKNSHILLFHQKTTQELILSSNFIKVGIHSFLTRKQLMLNEPIIETVDTLNEHSMISDNLISRSAVELYLFEYEIKSYDQIIWLLYNLLENASIFLPLKAFEVVNGTTLLLEKLTQFTNQTISDIFPLELTGNTIYHELLFNFQNDSSIDRMDCNLFDNIWIHNSSVALSRLLFFSWSQIQKQIKNILIEKSYLRKSLVQITQELDQTKLISTRIILYVLFLGILTNDCTRTLNRKTILSLSDSLNLTFEEIETLFSLASLDCQINVYSSTMNLTSNLSIATLDAMDLTECVIKRLCTLYEINALELFITTLSSKNHPIMQSKLAVIASGVCLTSINTWEIEWQRFRTYCDTLKSTEDSLVATKAITKFMCLWAIRNKQMSLFLSKEFNLVEVEEIIEFLTFKAELEITNKVFPSHYVNTLIGFLLKNRRIDTAQKFNDLYKNEFRSDDLEIKNSIQDREVLIETHLKLPKLSSFDHDLILNLDRGQLSQIIFSR